MTVVTLDYRDVPPPACRGGAAAVGNFDGVHRGHLALLQRLAERAHALRGPAVAVTFDPHPLQLLRPEKFLPVLTAPAERARLLRENGADCVVVLRATRELLSLSAADFFEGVVCERLAARALVEGANFAFGRAREAGVDRLRELCVAARLELNVVSPVVTADGVPVSSSRVRASLVAGDVRRAAELLGRYFRLWGRVIAGRGRGRTLGFPTANLEEVASLVPGEGVYAVRVLRGEAAWAGAANIGPNPTFGEQRRRIEVHLIDFQGDLYGQALGVEFVERLRDTVRFSGAEALTAQLHTDVERARQALALTGNNKRGARE